MPRKDSADKAWKPTREQLLAARGKTVPDIIAAGLKVLFCGINPGLYSGAVAHHFARPGNRFWPALHAGGFTPRQLSPFEEQELLQWGYGITNIVRLATATADELTLEDLVSGAKKLRAKLARFRPAIIAIVGVGAYRAAFQQPTAVLGLQPDLLGKSAVWLLPNPSGLNAHYQPAELGRLFGDLRRFVEQSASPPRIN